MVIQDSLTEDRARRDSLQDSMNQAYEKWRERWSQEKDEPGHEPQKIMRYTITLYCTHSEFQSVLTAIKGFCIGRRYTRQEEIGEDDPHYGKDKAIHQTRY